MSNLMLRIGTFLFKEKLIISWRARDVRQSVAAPDEREREREKE
jgi:hypothetical protein